MGDEPPPLETDPAIVTELIGRTQASIAALQRDIRAKSGAALVDFILADIPELKRLLFDPRSHQVFMAAMDATWWLNEQLHAWLGEKNAADTLTQSVPNNVTSEMGLALLDVADVIRPHPDVVVFLHHVDDDGFLDELAKLEGGREARDAIGAYLDMYGMRCVGEIDITRPRWSERPTTLVPVILGNIKNFEPGEPRGASSTGGRRRGRRNRSCWSACGPCRTAAQKAEETKRKIDRVRTFIGYREYPKYGMVSRYFVYKQALLAEAERLVQAHVLRERTTSSTSRSRSYTTSCAPTRWMTSSSASAGRRSGPTERSRRPGCSRRMAKPSPGRTDATICRPARWSACRFPPGRSRGGPASSSTWRRPTSKPATSSSPPTPTPAGRPCS